MWKHIKIQNPGGSSLTQVLTRDCLSLLHTPYCKHYATVFLKCLKWTEHMFFSQSFNFVYFLENHSLKNFSIRHIMSFLETFPLEIYTYKLTNSKTLSMSLFYQLIPIHTLLHHPRILTCLQLIQSAQFHCVHLKDHCLFHIHKYNIFYHWFVEHI